MCGICGFCDFTRDNAGPVWREAGERMGETLAHRGPDGKGLWQGADCVLVHRRLAVIDPERGQQPMARVRDGVEYVLIYNGELYNTDELRRELRKLGFSFETESDTEVLLNACIAWGDGAAQRLEGIFAFAFWDGGRRRLMCCRDRFGVKPFFYAWKDGALVFASELKALFQYPGLEPRLGRQGLCEVLGIGPARTAGAGVFEGVRELKGGCQLTAGPEGLQIRRYCVPSCLAGWTPPSLPRWPPGPIRSRGGSPWRPTPLTMWATGSISRRPLSSRTPTLPG